MAVRKQERRVHWAAYLWPGLPHLWIAGSWAGLVLAVGFTGLLNVVILATLVWPEWLPPQAKRACVAMLGVIWLAAIWETRREIRRLSAMREHGETGDTEPDDLVQSQLDLLLRKAQGEHLEGDWLAAERTLSELLKINRRDVEGQLLLATVLRHTGRFDQAESQLTRLERLEDAAMWQFEISRERELIAFARQTKLSDPLPPGEETSPMAA